jgi:hypothetical protein
MSYEALILSAGIYSIAEEGPEWIGHKPGTFYERDMIERGPNPSPHLIEATSERSQVTSPHSSFHWLSHPLDSFDEPLRGLKQWGVHARGGGGQRAVLGLVEKVAFIRKKVLPFAALHLL